jgi:nicotinamide-nucleotide amidase
MRELKSLMLASPRLTLAAAESLTCGRVQARIGEISGASHFFLGGVTAYTLEAKVRQLGVERCALFGSDLGVATTGYAEPSPDDGVRDPFAWWAIAHRSRGKFKALRGGRVECPGATRVDVQMFVADAADAELVAYLRELRG